MRSPVIQMHPHETAHGFARHFTLRSSQRPWMRCTKTCRCLTWWYVHSGSAPESCSGWYGDADFHVFFMSVAWSIEHSNLPGSKLNFGLGRGTVGFWTRSVLCIVVQSEVPSCGRLLINDLLMPGVPTKACNWADKLKPACHGLMNCNAGD